MSLKSYPEEVAFTNEISQVTLRLLELTFEEATREYRRVEAEFITRVSGDEEDIWDIQRRITAQILVAARGNEQPHEVCQAIWEELAQRGFSDHEQKSIYTGIYARCCQENGEFDAGIAVLEPLITEAEQWLEQATFPPESRAYWEHDLATDYKIRDELKAGIRETLMPRWGPWEPEEIALTQRINAVHLRERKHRLSFEDAAREYRQIETEFVERAGDNEGQAIEARRRIAEVLLNSAYETDQSHEVCRGIWDELVHRGFTNVERRHTMGDTYTECCQLNGEFDAGLAVIEKLIMELESNLEDTTLTTEERHFREMTLHSHRRLRDKLKAGIQ